MAVDFANDVDLISVTVPGSTQVVTVAVPGIQGPPGQFTVGTTTTGEAGTSAAVTTQVNSEGIQVVNFAIPRGATGVAGPANSITIGTVSTGNAGTTASASVTGTSPNQTLNLTIPRGDTGSAGPANTLTIGTVATGSPGSLAAASISGTSPNQILNLTLPGGMPGETGPANTLTIGTVTTAPPGSQASAVITGEAPNQVLSLTLPKGEQGPAGSGAVDATTSIKGSVKLAGDLGGTADLPTVPGLANKADTVHTHTASQISDSTATGRSLIVATDAATARSAIGAGTSNLAIGTTGTTAAAGNHTHTAANISDSTTVGRSVLTATDASAARTAIGAGVSNLTIGTTGTTAKAGDYQPTAANISDSTAVGRSVLTATDAAAARTAIGAGTSSLVIGTTAGTAAAGNDSRLSDARTPLSHTHGVADLTTTGTRDSTTYLRGDGVWASPPGSNGGGTVTVANITDATAIGRTVLTSADAAAVRTAIGAGTSNLAIGTTGTTAAAGNHTHTAANISDSTATGRSVLTAADAAAARTAIGAGTSNLALGTTASTALAGNYTAPVTSVATKTGAVTLAKGDVGLGNVDNTSDANKPVSTAQQTALNGKANTTHTHAISDVTSLQAALDSRQMIVPQAEGQLLTIYTHSYGDPLLRYGNNGPSSRYVDRMSDRLGTVLDNNSTGGWHMQDLVLDAIGNRDSTKRWPIGEKGIAVIDGIMNDAIKWGSTAAALTNFEHNFRSLCWWLSTETANTYSDRESWITYSAAWLNLNHDEFWGGTLKQLPMAQAGNFTWSHVNNPGKWALAFVSTSTGGREIEVLVNGSVVKTQSTNVALNCEHVTASGARVYGLTIVTFDIAAGTHTVLVRNKTGGLATADLFFDSLSKINTVDPARIFVPQAIYNNSVADSVIDAYNTRATLVAAEFGNVQIVNTLTGWNKATMLADAVHPNKMGNAHIADRLTASVINFYLANPTL